MALSVTKHIYKQLSESTALTSIVGTRIYPVNIPNGTPAFPFVVFDTQTGQPDYTKDGLSSDSHSVTVYVLARDYMSELLPAAEAVRSALELVAAEYPTFVVTECTLDSAVDGWDDTLQCYLYTLTFAITTENVPPLEEDDDTPPLTEDNV